MGLAEMVLSGLGGFGAGLVVAGTAVSGGSERREAGAAQVCGAGAGGVDVAESAVQS